MADDGSQQRKPDFRTAVEDVKALATFLVMKLESVLGRRLYSDLITRDRRVVDLTGADFTRAYLGKVSLSKADLSGAILSEAYMSEAVLEHADLSLANLSSAERLDRKSGAAATFQGDTSLAGANLKRAKLQMARLTDEQLAECKSLDGATMPNGQIYEEWLKTPNGLDWLRKHE